MFYKNTAVIDKTSLANPYYLYEPIIDFYCEWKETYNILKEAPHKLETDKSNFFSDELAHLSDIYENMEYFPKSSSDLYNYDLKNSKDIEKLEKFKNEIIKKEGLQKKLDKVIYTALTKSFFETELGQRLLRKIFKIIKRMGGNGATTIGTQVACELAKKDNILYIEIDTDKIDPVHGIPSMSIGDAENILKLIFQEKPKARLKNKADFTLDIMKRRRNLNGVYDKQKLLKTLPRIAEKLNSFIDKTTDNLVLFKSKIETTNAFKELSGPEQAMLLNIIQEARANEEFMLFNHKTKLKNLHLELFKFLRLDRVNKSNSLFMMLRLFIDFAKQLDQYDYIIFDEGPLNTLSHAFFSYFLTNHILTIPFDDYALSQFLEPQEGYISGTVDFYNDLLQSLKSMYQCFNNDKTIEHNTLLALNERNSSEDEKNTPGYTVSKYFEKIQNNLEGIEKFIAEKTVADKKNSKQNIKNVFLQVYSVVIPFYWQAYANENKTDKVSVPILDLADKDLLNNYFKKAVQNIAEYMRALKKQQENQQG